MKKTYFTTLLLLFISCSNPTLDGHYHLEWNNGNSQFQVWNIKNNRMRINEEVCEREDNCFYSKISFNRNKIEVRPWVDIVYEAKYEMFTDGSLYMYTTYDEKIDTLKLIPHKNCKLNDEYLYDLTKDYTKSFEIESDLFTGKSSSLNQNKIELTIGIKDKDDQVFLLFNKKQISKINEIPISNEINGKSIWVHIDSRVQLSQIINILKYLTDKGYTISFTAKTERENKEQIQLITRNIESIIETNNQFEVNLCLFCEKYPNNPIDSIFNIRMIEVEKYILGVDTIDLFQTRNKIVDFLGKNRTTRLNNQIQIEIPASTNFGSYQRLIDDLNFVHISLSEIVYYNGKDDKDMKAIKNHSINTINEFPIRIKEIIK